MVALITTVVLPGLFAVSALFAAIVLVQSWRIYGGAWARLQGELVACDSVQAAPVRIVRPAPGVAAKAVTPARHPAVQSAQVLALRPAISLPRVPVRLATLPAAA